jgi:hypothetical protein
MARAQGDVQTAAVVSLVVHHLKFVPNNRVFFVCVNYANTHRTVVDVCSLTLSTNGQHWRDRRATTQALAGELRRTAAAPPALSGFDAVIVFVALNRSLFALSASSFLIVFFKTTKRAECDRSCERQRHR